MGYDEDMVRRRPPQLRDVYLLPLGTDIFTATGADLWGPIVVTAASALDVAMSAEVQRVRATHYVADHQAAGTISPIAQQIHARARAEADAKARRQYDRNPDRARRGLEFLGSRPLGGG